MTTPSPDRRIVHLAARQFGVFSRQQAMRSGFDPQVIRYRLSSGRWERIAHNVFRLSGVPDGWHQGLLVACLSWGDGATISHRAAGKLRRLAGFDKDLVELTVPPQRRGGGPGMVHRSPLAAADVDVINGIPVTKVARTLIDVAAVVHRDVVEEALDDALRRGLVSIGLLRGRLREVGGRGGRRGVTVMRELIEARVDEGVPQSVSKPGCSGFSRAVASPSLCSSTECRRLGGRLQLWILRFPRFELGSRPTATAGTRDSLVGARIGGEAMS